MASICCGTSATDRCDGVARRGSSARGPRALSPGCAGMAPAGRRACPLRLLTPSPRCPHGRSPRSRGSSRSRSRPRTRRTTRCSRRCGFRSASCSRSTTRCSSADARMASPRSSRCRNPTAVAAAVPSSLFGALVGTLIAGPLGLIVGGVLGGGGGALVARLIESGIPHRVLGRARGADAPGPDRARADGERHRRDGGDRGAPSVPGRTRGLRPAAPRGARADPPRPGRTGPVSLRC